MNEAITDRLDNISNISDEIRHDIELVSEREKDLKDLMEKVIVKLGDFTDGRGFKSTNIEALSRLIEVYTKMPIEKAKLRKMLIDTEMKYIDILKQQDETDMENEKDVVSISSLYELMNNNNIHPVFANAGEKAN